MTDQATDTEEQAPRRKKRGVVTLVKAIALLSVLVVVEVVTAALVIPSPHETEELARQLAAARHGAEARSRNRGYTPEAEAEEVVEMEIGQFSITRYNVEADTTINVDFEVFVTVLAEDQELFARLFATNRNRVREQINLTVQAATPADLSDRGLGLIKRQILEKINRVLGRPLVRDVLLTRFNFVPR